jgi:hypothetical protein
MTDVKICIGWSAPPLKEQLPLLPDDVASHFEKDAEAIRRLKIRGLLSPSVAEKARERLLKNIRKAANAASGGKETGHD